MKDKIHKRLPYPFLSFSNNRIDAKIFLPRDLKAGVECAQFPSMIRRSSLASSGSFWQMRQATVIEKARLAIGAFGSATIEKTRSAISPKYSSGSSMFSKIRRTFRETAT